MLGSGVLEGAVAVAVPIPVVGMVAEQGRQGKEITEDQAGIIMDIFEPVAVAVALEGSEGIRHSLTAVLRAVVEVVSKYGERIMEVVAVEAHIQEVPPGIQEEVVQVEVVGVLG